MLLVAGYINVLLDIRHWNDTASWEEQFEETRLLTSLTERLVKLAPETGAYLNEVCLMSIHFVL